MKTKKVPERRCVGCMEMKPKKELIRIVRNKEGEISVDLTGKKPGRGAYVCKNQCCFNEAFKTKRLDRSLGHNIEEEVYDKLKDEITNA
ncbi:hypothetical protein SAMN02745248_00056 [Hathewaya proteolytica DSM 3090]|uniref:YlxR domain-containing protein n=1 Tax=Hathewaya proteolytica DSM 3090 TaxID=1121331 RepID=A0A1M6J5W4_9CLOT|nr:YlxR family protein [Hathewaya proteolytica]SHJ42052.1 hypothetical protein SAMN02745248_00056 [Hathewaya proteolytica DSM 3090]